MRLRAITLAEFKKATGLTQGEVCHLIEAGSLLVIETDGRSKTSDYRRTFVPVQQVLDHSKPINKRSFVNLIDLINSLDDPTITNTKPASTYAPIKSHEPKTKGEPPLKQALAQRKKGKVGR